MTDNPWVSSIAASNNLGVSETTLILWREIGYLKHGTHWRRLNEFISVNATEEILYHMDWCKEEMEYWKSHNAIIEGLAA